MSIGCRLTFTPYPSCLITPGFSWLGTGQGQFTPLNINLAFLAKKN